MFRLVPKENEPFIALKPKLERSRYCGFCIVRMSDSTDEAKIDGYLHDFGNVSSLDENHIAYPKLYASSVFLFKKYHQLKKEREWWEFRLAVWYLDDISEPLEKYEQMLNRVPGSPTQ